jgi:hypothetical protein
VEVAGGPLFLAGVDDQRADFEGGGVFIFGVGGGVGSGVRDSADGAEKDGVDLGGGGGAGLRGYGADEGDQEEGDDTEAAVQRRVVVWAAVLAAAGRV